MIEGLPALVQSTGSAQSAAGAGDASRAAPTAKLGLEDGFAEVLAEVAGKVGGNIENAEAVSAAALKGQADTRDVVDAVMSAEQTLQAAIAIRDKIVTAYLEISRMAI